VSKRNVARGVETAGNTRLAMDHIQSASQKVREMVSSFHDSMGEQVFAVRELSKVLDDIGDMSASISTSTEQQTEKARHLSSAVEKANQITHAASASAQEISAAVAQLSEPAMGLQAVAGQFRVSPEHMTLRRQSYGGGQAPEGEAISELIPSSDA
jgi:methyl-accepting chemotaxis protein